MKTNTSNDVNIMKETTGTTTTTTIPQEGWGDGLLLLLPNVCIELIENCTTLTTGTISNNTTAVIIIIISTTSFLILLTFGFVLFSRNVEIRGLRGIKNVLRGLFDLVFGCIALKKTTTKDNAKTDSGADGDGIPNGHFRSSYGVYQNAAVASDSKICSDIGRDIMSQQGGNAIDAGVATALASTVIYPHSTGIGGGFFAVLCHQEHGWHTVDARETAPLGIKPEMFSRPEDKGKAFKGGMSICVPGFIKGLYEMHKQFGSIPWSSVVAPTLKLLRHGFPLSNQTYYALVREIATSVVGMKGFELYLDTNGQVKPPGSVIQDPTLARTVQIISEDPLSFYNGKLARDIIEDLQDAGSILQPRDLEKYRALIKPTLRTEIPGGYTVHTVPPPGGGVILNYILSVMTGYGLSPDCVATEEAALLTYHRFAEASRFAMARKTELGDEHFVDVKEVVEKMLSKKYGGVTRKQIDDSSTLDLDVYGAKFYNAKDGGTSHSSILDKDGNAVTITGSLCNYFGSLVVGKRTGFVFNNEMYSFSHLYQTSYHSLQPSEANFVQPGKRPMASMSPAIVWDNHRDRVCLVTGAAGGIKIPEALAKTICDVLYFNQSVIRSIDAPKIYQELVPPILMAEDGIEDSIIRGLEEKGHHFLRQHGFTVIQTIHVTPNGAVVAGSDYRKGGQPSGF